MPGQWWEDDSAYVKPFWEDDDAYAVHRPDEPTFLEEMGAKIKAGFGLGTAQNRETGGRLLPDLASDATKATEDRVARELGYKDRADQDRAEQAQRIAQDQREFQMTDRTSDSTERGLQEIHEAEGPIDAIGAVARNPRAVAAVTAQSLGMIAPGMAAAAAAGPAAPAVVGVSSAAMEFESTIAQTMEEAGYDLTDPAQVRRALDDPELMARAKEKGATRGLAIGLFDAATAGLAGRLLAGAKGAVSSAGRVAGETGMQMAGGAAGESVAQLATEGRIDKWGDVVTEGIAEVPTAITEVPTNYRRAVRAGERRATRAEVQSDYRALADEFGATITSLDRTPEHNRKVGGTPNSQHIPGTAGDFVVPDDRKTEFKLQARAQGYEVIDEGDHIHLELPPGGRSSATAELPKSKGATTVEDLITRSRESRGMPPVRKEHDHSSSTESAPATPIEEPVAREELVRRANDTTIPPLQRRAAKRQLQQPEAPVQKISDRIMKLRDQMLEQVTQQAQQIEAPPIQRSELAEPAERVEWTSYQPQQPTPPQIPQTPQAPAQPPIQQQPPAQPQPPQAPDRDSVFQQLTEIKGRLEEQLQNPNLPPAIRKEMEERIVLIDRNLPQAPVQRIPSAPPSQPRMPAQEQGLPELRQEVRTVDKAQFYQTSKGKVTPIADAMRQALNLPGAEGMLRGLQNTPKDQKPKPLKRGDLVEVRMSAPQQRQLDVYGKLLGRRIVPFDFKTPGYMSIGGLANDDKHIFINVRGVRNGQINMASLIGHEFLHTLRRAGSTEVEELIDFVNKNVKLDSPFFKQMMDLYVPLLEKSSRNDMEMKDKLNEELLADFVGDMLSDERFWQELAKQDPSLFKRSLTKFIEFLQDVSYRALKLLRLHGGQSWEETFFDVDQLRAKAEAMLANHVKRVANGEVQPAPEQKDFEVHAMAAAAEGLTAEEAQAMAVPSASLQSKLTNGFLGQLPEGTIEYALKDEFIDLVNIQKLIGEQVFGGRVPPDYDARRNENLSHGAYKDAREHAEARFIAPVERAISKADASMEEFSDYLWWRHAGERDAYLRQHLDPNLQIGPDELAGIDPAQAQANIDALDPRKRQAFERAAKFIDGMREFTNKTLLDSGQITQQHYDNLRNQYQFYVPLRGQPGAENTFGGFGQKGGLSMNRNPIGKRAAGRSSKPENIIEHMMRDMDNALVGVQKQRVLDSLVKLIAAHPDPALWELAPVTAERKWVDGVLKVVQTNGQPADQITFMHRGIPVKIEIRHERLRTAMLNLTDDNIPRWIRGVGRVTRWLSAMKTSWSPFFLLVNPVRDGQMAMMSLLSEHGMDSLKSFAKFYPHTYGVIFAADRHRKVPPAAKAIVRQLQQYEREFSAIGGKTGYTYVSDIREQTRKINKLIARNAKTKGWKDIAKGDFHTKDAGLIARKGFQHFSNLLEITNDMAENSTRLAVYAAMREKGLSVEDAAEYAKNATVNFNRRGRLARYLGPLYMFYNAAMQGGARNLELFKNKRYLAMMGSLFAGSYALVLAQMLQAGDDDDGESNYEKAINDSQAHRSLSIWLGEDKSLALPVAYGPNIFSYAGHRLAKMTYDMMRGREVREGDVAGDIMAQVMMSMSPIDPGKGAQAFLPEVVRMPAQIRANKNDFGGPIAPKVDPRDRTDGAKYRDTDTKTAEPYMLVAQALNFLTGGDAYRGGMVNVTGEHVRYGVESTLGGPARLVSESVELFDNLYHGIDPEPSDIPLANVYYRGKGNKRHASSYYDNMDDYKNTVDDWKTAIDLGDEKKLDEIIRHAPWIEGAELDAGTKEGKAAQAGSVMEGARDIDRQMKALRRERDAILGDDSLTRTQKKQALYQIDQEIAELQQDFNYNINAGRGYLDNRQ